MRKTSLLLLLLLAGCSGNKKELKKSYDPGFKIIRMVDKSRVFNPNIDSSDNLHFRPIDIDVWYPAQASGIKTPLLFRNILGLLEKRANYYGSTDKWKGVTSQIAQSFCDGFKCSDTAKLLNFKTRSLKDAAPVHAIFPIVIYMCAYNGMSYENFTLFEELAMKGFVVASISSVGRYPGDMTMRNEDLLEQVNDALASLRLLKRDSEIDFTKIGIIGYSWGGLSGAILAGKIPNISCVISLDGSEFHHYGNEQEENADFEGIRSSPGFKNLSISIPYLRLESSGAGNTAKVDSIYNFSEKLKGEKSIIKIDSAQHEDFSCLSAFVRESGNCKSNNYYSKILSLTIHFLANHLHDK